MNILKKPRLCFLTLTRKCNLNCSWCYAKKAEDLQQDLDVDTAKKIIDMCEELKLDYINLVGGEPTLYPQFFDLIKYIKQNTSCSALINTNAYVLAEESNVKRLKEAGIDLVIISLKGKSKEEYIDITDVDAFDVVTQAMELCNKYGIGISTMITVTPESINSVVEMARISKRYNAVSVAYLFYDNYNSSLDYDIDYMKKFSPLEIIKAFEHNYDELNEILGRTLQVFAAYPLCLMNKKILGNMIKNDQIVSICPVLKRSGFTIDTNGAVSPCNVMCDSTILDGKFDVDFSNGETFLKWWNSDEMLAKYQAMQNLPAEQCENCDLIEYCGGGCVSQWTNYDFNQIKQNKIDRTHKDRVLLKTIENKNLTYKNITRKSEKNVIPVGVTTRSIKRTSKKKNTDDI